MLRAIADRRSKDQPGAVGGSDAAAGEIAVRVRRIASRRTAALKKLGPAIDEDRSAGSDDSHRQRSTGRSPRYQGRDLHLPVGTATLQIVRGLWSTARSPMRSLRSSPVSIRVAERGRSSTSASCDGSASGFRSRRSSPTRGVERPDRASFVAAASAYFWPRCRILDPRRCSRTLPSARMRGWRRTDARPWRRWATSNAPAPTC